MPETRVKQEYSNIAGEMGALKATEEFVGRGGSVEVTLCVLLTFIN